MDSTSTGAIEPAAKSRPCNLENGLLRLFARVLPGFARASPFAGGLVELREGDADRRTYAALRLVASAQRRGLAVALVDAAQTLDSALASRAGVSLPDLVAAQPDSPAEALAIADSLARSGAFDAIIVDSLDSFDRREPRSRTDRRRAFKTMRSLSAFLARSAVICIFTTDEPIPYGVVFDSPAPSPETAALRRYACCRI